MINDKIFKWGIGIAEKKSRNKKGSLGNSMLSMVFLHTNMIPPKRAYADEG